MVPVGREPHENVATVLVAPSVIVDLELELMARDLRMWPVATAPICVDGPRQAFQLRHRLLTRHRGEWDLAADWTPVWIGFGDAWHEFGPDGSARPTGPLPWAAHQRLWRALEEFGSLVRYRRRLGGIPTEPTGHWPGLHVR